MRRTAALARLVLGGLLGSVALVAAPVPAGTASASGSTVTIDGRGWGHGIGMSQWGAYGYAVDHGWSYTQILDHYYGGTVMATTDVTSVAVRMLLHDDRQTAVVNDLGTLVVDGVAGGPWRSVVVRETAPSSYTVWARADQIACPADGSPLTTGWTLVASGVSPSVTVRTQTDTAAATDYRELPALCEPDGKVRSYRGFVRAVNGTDGENRTVNVVPLEQYLRSVIAKEMSPSWANAGGGKGAHALRAQAVAARSYALAENRYSYARTCDLSYCQVYLGAALRSSTVGNYVAVEHPLTDAAVVATQGQVRRVGHTAGPVAYAMFSASSGGYTAPSTLPFPAVPDLGDATPGNPSSFWTVDVAATTIEARYPSIGGFVALEVLARNGYGEWGGRVTSVRVVGTTSSVTVTGDQLRSALGLKSNLFAVRGDAPAPEPEGCGTRTPPPAGELPPPAPPARFSPLEPRRLLDTREPDGADPGLVPAGCTVVIDPGLGPDATAVAVNITSVAPATSGFVSAYPCGVERPLTASVLGIARRVVGGASVVPLGSDGRFCVYTHVAAHLVVDLFGVYGSASGHRYEPIVATRRADTRPGRILAAGSVTRVPIVGPGAAPAGSVAAVLTVHAASAVADGFVTVYPCTAQRPLVSSLNAPRATAVANQVSVALSASGEVCVYVHTSMHVVVDLSGWFGPGATTELYAATPTRLVDSRIGLGLATTVPGSANRSFTVLGTGGVPSDARAVVGSLTAVGPRTAGFVTVHPCLSSVPNLSMVRYTSAGNAANVVTSPPDVFGRWCVMPSTQLDIVFDVSGWYR